MSFRRGETDRIREPRTAGVPMVNGYLVLRNPLGYLTEAPDGWLVPTTDGAAATHMHVVDPVTGDYTVASIEEAEGMDAPVMILEDSLVDIYAPDDPAAERRRYLEPTADDSEATHAHAVESASGDIIVATLDEASAMPRPRELIIGDTLLIYGV